MNERYEDNDPRKDESGDEMIRYGTDCSTASNENSAWTRSAGWHLARNIQPLGSKAKMHLPF